MVALSPDDLDGQGRKGVSTNGTGVEQAQNEETISSPVWVNRIEQQQTRMKKIR